MGILWPRSSWTWVLRGLLFIFAFALVDASFVEGQDTNLQLLFLLLLFFSVSRFARYLMVGASLMLFLKLLIF